MGIMACQHARVVAILLLSSGLATSAVAAPPKTPAKARVVAKPPPPPPACPEPPPAPPPPPRPSTVRVMLPDLEVAPRFETTRAALGQIVAEEAGRVKGYELLSAADVRAVLDQEAGKQLVGCDDNSCLAELAEAMDAELLVSGRVDMGTDGAPLVSLSIVNARALVVVNRVTATWRGEEGRLPDVVRTSAQRLLLPAKERAPGAVVVQAAPVGARVLVDGVDRTRDHEAGRIGGLDVGVHEIAVEAPDRLPRIIPVVVMSGQDAVVSGALDDVPVPAAWLWVGGVGAVVAGAALTGTVLYFSGRGEVDVAAAVPSAGVNDVEALRGIGK
jgi:hypothetical protein